MTELLENSDNTNESDVISESPANEATISLAAVQALADALQKIEAYTPTVWVDNESPDIDAVHLNKAEQAIMRVTTAMNSAVDVIKDLQSQVNTTNNNLSKKWTIGAKIASTCKPSTDGGASFNTVPFKIIADNPTGGEVAGIGFELNKVIGGALYLASDGNLYFMLNNGTSYKIQMAKVEN